MIQLPLISHSEALRRLESDIAAAQGMSQSAAHAEAVDDGFHERAYGLLTAFCRLQATQPFTSEDFRLYAHREDFPIAVPKALGAVFKRAAKNGLIRRDGFGKAFSRHGSPCPLWRSVT